MVWLGPEGKALMRVAQVVEHSTSWHGGPEFKPHEHQIDSSFNQSFMQLAI
jgi:hypothetical protein